MDDNEHPYTMEQQQSGPIILSLNVYTIKLKGHLFPLDSHQEFPKSDPALPV
jgi:hypothetical protein